MAILAFVLLAGASGPDTAAAVTITIYTDRIEWQNALGGLRRRGKTSPTRS
ncbi:MAG: hypothetical protein IPI34_03495 [bacterium]|nr:hypothetical protein [bacterium]